MYLNNYIMEELNLDHYQQANFDLIVAEEGKYQMT